MENPNEYDDEQYTRGVGKLADAIGDLWEGGASVENLQSEIANAIENAASVSRVTVMVYDN